MTHSNQVKNSQTKASSFGSKKGRASFFSTSSSAKHRASNKAKAKKKRTREERDRKERRTNNRSADKNAQKGKTSRRLGSKKPAVKPKSTSKKQAKRQSKRQANKQPANPQLAQAVMQHKQLKSVVSKFNQEAIIRQRQALKKMIQRTYDQRKKTRQQQRQKGRFKNTF